MQHFVSVKEKTSGQGLAVMRILPFHSVHCQLLLAVQGLHALFFGFFARKYVVAVPFRTAYLCQLYPVPIVMYRDSAFLPPKLKNDVCNLLHIFHQLHHNDNFQ